MTVQGKAPEKERRDWIIVLIILLFGFLCVIIAGEWAIRFAPTWKLNTDMGTNIDPNSNFQSNRPNGFFEPLDPSILTQPVWLNVFLTPGASFQTSTPVTILQTKTPRATNTNIPTVVISPTFTATLPSPTNTVIYYPLPTSTNTKKPPRPTNTPTPTNTPVPTNTPIPADLSLTKDDGNTSYTAGGVAIYTITVSNNGPNNVTGAVITDNIPTQITTWSWVCTSQNGGANGCDAVANSGANFSDTVNLPNGASIVYTVTANTSAGATGNLVNTATVNVPAGYSDTALGNNSATDTDTLLNADLQVTKDDGSPIYTPGSPSTYTVTVSNNGPGAVVGAMLTDSKPVQITQWSWACTSMTGGAAGCDPVTNDTNDFNDTIDLPVGASIIYTVTADVSAGAAGTLMNTATISVPAGYTDPNAGNNSATDSDTSATGGDPNIGPPDGNAVIVPPGGSITMVFTPAIVANGDVGTPDLVYYEILAGLLPTPHIDLDWVRIEISSDGVTWYQVFFWYDPSPPDTNTNVDLGLPNISASCMATGVPAEDDNCSISSADLYNGTGITIDVDPFVPAGNYSWIRISSPAGAMDGANVDAIQPYYP